MAKTIKTKCSCGEIFFPRVSDVKRGWGKSCSKSCAASKRDNSKYYAAKKKAKKKHNKRKKKPYGLSEMLAEKVYLLDNPIQIYNEFDNEWEYNGPHGC